MNQTVHRSLCYYSSAFKGNVKLIIMTFTSIYDRCDFSIDFKAINKIISS